MPVNNGMISFKSGKKNKIVKNYVSNENNYDKKKAKSFPDTEN